MNIKRILWIVGAILLTGGLINVAWAANNLPAPKRLVFLPFYFKGSNNVYGWVSNSVIDAINEEIGSVYRYTRVSDKTVEAAQNDLQLSDRDLAMPENLLALGKKLNASGILVGSFYLHKDTGKLNITGRLFSVQQNSFINKETRAVILDSGMFDEVNAMGRELGKSMKEIFVPSDFRAAGMSAIYPGWGQEYKKYNKRAKYFRWGLGASALLSAGSITAFYIYRDSYYSYTPDFTVNSDGDVVLIDREASDAKMDHLRSRTNTWQSISYVMLGVTAAIYMYNLVDAYLLEQNPREIYTPEHLKKKSEVSFFFKSGRQQLAYKTQYKFIAGVKYEI